MLSHATSSKDGCKLRTCLHPSRRIAAASGDRNAPQDEDGGFLAIRAAVPLKKRLRHVADGIDLEAAIHRRASGLHARARRQHCGAAEIATVDAVELLLLALVLEPHDHLEQAIHVGAR